MKRLLTLVAPALFLLTNCSREEQQMKVSYSVHETSADQPAYNITYTSDQSGATTIAGSSSDDWNSGTLTLKRGQFISLTVDCNAPVFDFTVSVFVDGALWGRKELHSPSTSVSISGSAGN